MTKEIRPWALAAYTVNDGDDTRIISLKGRDRWTLEMLMQAGEHGLTAMELNGPRVHAYVFDLRHEHGLTIITENEMHEGDFPGRHGRYFLLSNVTRKMGGAA